jgi:hypothetical protein
VAPDVIWSTVQGVGAMSRGGDAAAASLNGTVRVTNREAPGSHRPRLCQKDGHHAVGKSERALSELTDWDGLRGGRRHGGGNRSISEIPAYI